MKQLKQKKPSLLCTESTIASRSLKRIALGLSTKLKRGKIWRTTSPSLVRKQFRYGQSVNKLQQYQWFKDNNILALEFTTDSNVASEWLKTGHTVFGRKYLNASCGKGIVVLEPEVTMDIPELPVYTKYKKKKREFRVHVFKDQVVSVVEKRKRKGFDGERETKVRNLANGYVFCQTVENEPEGLRAVALAAAKVSPSDFRGVDIGYNEKKDELFVIEVNSAPGIEGSNVNKYLDAMVQYV
jgi:glutathione synthase/RimK-type ligase-like ATP-grasp enzyme